jgi:Zn ribbon nucleic-acid-binding protein
MMLQCPNCQAIWSMEEIDEQYCGACGYPDCEEDGDYYNQDEYEDIETDANGNCFSDADPGL